MSISFDPVTSRRDLREFIDFPKRLYAHTPQWVPAFDADYREFYRGRHPFFAHAYGGFFLLREDGRPVARVLMIENERYNRQHERRAAHFYFLDFIDREDVSQELFRGMAQWAASRGLDELMGPLFTGATFGAGVLVQGHDLTAAMTMMSYNHAYYPAHYEAAGFVKHFDLCSLLGDPRSYQLPERVERLADHVRRRGRLRVVRFRTKADLRRAAREVGALYNPTLADHLENYPLTDQELDRLIEDLLRIARPDLEKVITYNDRVIGFMLGFPDLTPAIQASRGKLTPRTIIALMRESKRPKRLIFNGMGILDGFQRIGGNALIYSELARTIAGMPAGFEEAEMVQINEKTDLMLADLQRLGAEVAKIHRVYRRPV